ncbi:MAG: HlyC/CorC family transporter [Firmicutes bacterium]|nr:HlyC/CorC family transporter [Bacillota bacterium]
MDSDSYTKLVLFFLCLGLSSFFSASEIAFTSLNKIHLRSMLDKKVKNADKVKKILDSPQKLLNTVLIGNNLVNTLASTLATSVVIKLSKNNNVILALSTAFVTFLILVFSEVTPKNFANQNPDKVALGTAKIIMFFAWILTPVVFVLNLVTNGFLILFGMKQEKKAPVVTESDLKTIVDVGHEEGILKVDEKEMINNVFEFGSSTAKDIMIPRTDVIAINLTTEYKDILNLFKDEGLSRIPVYNESIDNIIGILYLKDLVFNADQSNFEIKKYLRKPFFTYEYKPIRELFKVMRVKKIPMAIILDEYGGTSGIITIEDLVEEIVGDISDEYDENEKQIERIKENEYIIDGSTKIDDVNQELNINLKSEEFDTIGGYLIGVLGYFPKANKIIKTDGLEFIVECVEKNRIEKVRAKLIDVKLKENNRERKYNKN